MAKIFPFPAVRPTPEMSATVASNPFGTYTPEERKAQIASFPHSFLHIISPGYDSVLPSLQERYRQVRKRFEKAKNQGVFIQDETPCLYAYRISTPSHTYSGIIALTSTIAYENNVIKKHEHTLQQREIQFKNYLEQVRFNAEPVLLTYPDHPKLEMLLQEVMTEKASCSFTTDTDQHHTLWKINNEERIAAFRSVFETIPNLYIADGHHRCASSHRLSQMKSMGSGAHFFMSYLLPMSQIRIASFSRLVKGLNGYSTSQFLSRLSDRFEVTPLGKIPYAPQQKHHFGMYLDGNFYQLQSRPHQISSDLIASLDTQLLYDTVLHPILGIRDMRSDTRIVYHNEIQHPSTMAQRVDEEEFTVGFTVFPPNITEVQTFADLGLTMPPKSTYILPKLKSGLLLYEF